MVELLTTHSYDLGIKTYKVWEPLLEATVRPKLMMFLRHWSTKSRGLFFCIPPINRINILLRIRNGVKTITLYPLDKLNTGV